MMLVTSVNFPFFASLELDLRSTTLGNASSRKKERERECMYVGVLASVCKEMYKIRTGLHSSGVGLTN